MSLSVSDADVFTAGDLVVSVYGDGEGDGTYTDNQAAPIVLDELTTSGTPVTGLDLPETTTTVDGVTENAISGEYGSSSEGTLELAANGQSLVIAGYAVNDVTYNTGGAAVYGNAALAQSTSIQGGAHTAVARAIADISYTGTVDTSTAIYNVDNTNNPRSVATVDGSTFYLSGQGVKGDTTQGVFTVQDGSSTATAIDTANDTRTVEIYDGSLYVSQDSKQPSSAGGTSNISTFGAVPVTGATTPTVLAGISQTITLRAGQGNTLNADDTGTVVHVSPENFFFATATTLYVADGGDPKQGGIGDGGLQKWSLVDGSWTLDYTLSVGLNLVDKTATAGTTGLIGLTGVVTGTTVDLFATNSTLGDLDQTYLYGITDSLAATTLPADESFTTLMTAAADTNIRGVAFAPTAPCFAAGTPSRTARGEIPVEALAADDIVLTVGGGCLPIRWIGHRSVDCLRHPRAEAVLPVRIAADAFGPGLPERALYLSPDHAIFAEDVLIPVKHLINGESVAQLRVDRVTYYHVELPDHAILYAAGLPAESYLDTGDRRDFENGDTAMTLHPAWGVDARDVTLIHEALGAAPLRVTGAAVDRVRARLAVGPAAIAA
jgi:hypothetical protein